MNLNKPPLSEEQNALEEYVDFLLTDRSNVTPIHRKISLARHLNENKLKAINESVVEIIGLDLTRVDKDADKELDNKLDKALDKETNKKTEPDSGEPTDKTELKTTTDLTTAPVLADKTLADKALADKLLADDKKVNQSHFILESEEEELKKWDMILTREKELAILELERQQKKPDLNRAPPTAHNFPLKRALQSSSITSDRPAIFDEILPLKEPDERLANVEKLLSRISLATKPILQTEKQLTPELKQTEEELLAAQTVNEITEESVQATFIQRPALKTRDMLPSVFQTLIFNVGKLPLAVPLLKLGGIVHISEKQDITPLIGTPDWFMGLVPHERGNLMVIDTQKYLMPEKINENTSNKPYEYLIILDDSNWAIACHSVGEAKNLTLNDIRWSAKSSKRPWFGGMVVEYMSAIIEVDELINMLASNITD